MKIPFRIELDNPVSLNDALCNKLERENTSLRLYFSEGCTLLKGDFPSYSGSVVLDNFQDDNSFIYISGEKLSFSDFTNRYKEFSFRITDEAYGYTGLILQGTIDDKDALFSLSFMGDINYLLND